MKRTNADDAIIQALCPGPDDESAFGAPLVTYASRSATRVARSGAPADAAGAAGAISSAIAMPGSTTSEASTASPSRIRAPRSPSSVTQNGPLSDRGARPRALERLVVLMGGLLRRSRGVEIPRPPRHRPANVSSAFHLQQV